LAIGKGDAYIIPDKKNSEQKKDEDEMYLWKDRYLLNPPL